MLRTVATSLRSWQAHLHSAGAFLKVSKDRRRRFPRHQLVAYLCRLQAGLLVGWLLPRFPAHSLHSDLSQPDLGA